MVCSEFLSLTSCNDLLLGELCTARKDKFLSFLVFLVVNWKIMQNFN